MGARYLIQSRMVGTRGRGSRQGCDAASHGSSEGQKVCGRVGGTMASNLWALARRKGSKDPLPARAQVVDLGPLNGV